MLKIRLSRHGKKRQPSYRVVVSESKFKRDGRYVERLGWFNPLTDPETYLINEGRALYWLSVGAQPTDAVKRLLKKQGTLDRLARVHQGETIEALVAEYEGVDLTAQVAEKAEEPVVEVAAEAEEVAEEVAEPVAEQEEEAQGVVAEAIESVQETAGNVAEAVQDGLETAQEAVAEVVEQVSELITGSDEDEAEVAEVAEEENDAEVTEEEKVA